MTTKRIRFSYLTRVLILVGTAPHHYSGEVPHHIQDLARCAPQK